MPQDTRSKGWQQGKAHKLRQALHRCRTGRSCGWLSQPCAFSLKTPFFLFNAFPGFGFCIQVSVSALLGGLYLPSVALHCCTWFKEQHFARFSGSGLVPIACVGLGVWGEATPQRGP